MKKLMFLIVAAIMAFTPACSKRKKQAVKILSLHQNMTMGHVQRCLGEPDVVVASYVDSKGSQLDIWEYDLGIRDEEKHQTKVMFQIGGWFVFWPLLCFPQAWKSSWTYETYFFKFVNKALAQWGKKADIVDIQKEYGHTK